MKHPYTGRSALTVAELVEALAGLPPDLPIVAEYDGGQHVLVASVAVTTVEHWTNGEPETVHVVMLEDADNDDPLT